jgi:molybdenum cofactor biosynthesis enzyme MoaA
MFAVGVHGGIAVVFDPASGLTHCPTRDLPLGPVRLDGREVMAWPVVVLTDVLVTTPLSVSWSLASPKERPCPLCPEDESVTELPQGERVRLADVLAASGVLGVDICDCPTLSPRRLESLASRLTAGGSCVVSVTTTGQQLVHLADVLAGHVDAVRVALHSPDFHHHGPARTEVDEALPGVQAAVAVGLPVQIEAPLLGSTASQPQAIVDLAASLGAQGVTFIQGPRTVRTADVAAREEISDQDADALVEALRVPAGLTARLRTVISASTHIFIRADGRIWRNSDHGTKVVTLHPLTRPADLVLGPEEGRREH